jgi:hydroxylamine dehydrogenase
MTVNSVPLFAFVLFCSASPGSAQDTTVGSQCITCHTTVTRGIVSDWKLSKHSQVGVDCTVCHGDEHRSAADVAKAKIPTPDTCSTCHQTLVEQFKKGKHSLAWAAMKAMPTIHWQPMAMIEGEKGCGGCHKIGVKTPAEIADLRQRGSEFGAAACDSCHTRHTFSTDEARQPQACESCHWALIIRNGRCILLRNTA